MNPQRLGLFLVLGLAASSSCAAPERSADTMRFLSKSKPEEARLMADVAWLAHDDREGRRSGTPGEHASGDYIAKRFAELGLQPAGENGTWFQEFEVSLPARDGGKSSLIAHLSTGPVLIDGGDSIVPLFCSEGEPVVGRAWWVGYGIVNAEQDWNSYSGANLEGGIAVIVRGTPPEDVRPKWDKDGEAAVTKGHGWGNSGSIFHKVMTAKRHGAGGVLLIQHPDEAGEPLLDFDPSQIGEAGIPCAMITSEVAEQLIAGYAKQVRGIRREREKRGGVRFCGSGPKSLLVYPQLFPAPWALRESGLEPRVTVLTDGQEPRDLYPALTLELRSDVIRETASARNVLARRTGAIPGRTVVIGAHYDHLGHGGEGSLAPGEQGAIHTGDDDNASGVACVLELARVLSENWIPDGDVVFALWSGEELGLLGSEHFMRNPTIDLDDVRANINLDMVGRAGDGNLQVLGAGTSPSFAAWMEPAAEYADLDLEVSLSGQGNGGSDHHSFLRREIPALHLFSGTHADYHKPSDDTDKVEASGMRRVVLLCLDLTTRLHHKPWIRFSEVAEAQAASDRKRTSGARFGSVPSYIPDERGLVLDGTSPGGPAEAAGLLGGDILTEVGSIPIGTIHDFVFALQTYKPGDVVRVRYLRDGELEETRVTLTSNQTE